MIRGQQSGDVWCFTEEIIVSVQPKRARVLNDKAVDRLKPIII